MKAVGFLFLGVSLGFFQFVGVTPAWGYIPPSAFILKSLAAKHTHLKGVRIRTVVNAMEGDRPGIARMKTLTYLNPQTGVIRAYALSESNHKLFAIERRTENATLADAILFWSHSRNIALALKAKGISVRTEESETEIEQQFLARLGSTIAWVLGKESKEGKEPQLWVEKDTFLPLRLLVSNGGEEGLVDIQFQNQKYYREFPFPRLISVSKNKNVILKDEVQDVSITFDAAEFKTALAPGLTEAGRLASDEVRELIKKYFDFVR
ncbi:hypothetical protein WDW37_03285 [Bdellovibrionota bacterium FG-1]